MKGPKTPVRACMRDCFSVWIRLVKIFGYNIAEGDSSGGFTGGGGGW